MNSSRTLSSAESWMLWALVAVGSIARFIHLDSDPKFEHWIFYVEDEGRWIETARNLALFGSADFYGVSKLHFVLSPGFQAINFVIFKVAGIGFWSARLWSAATGAAILILSYELLRRHTTGLPLYLGVAILAFEPLMLSLGRTALPEIPSLLFTLLAFTAICAGRRRVLGAGLGGVLMAVAISMKGTTLLLVPVFLLMVALSGISETARSRLLRCSAFLLGALLPGLVGFGFVTGAGVVKVEYLSDVVSGLAKFLDVGGAYVMLFRFFEKSPIVDVNMLLLGAWVASWISTFWKEYRATPSGEIYVLTGIWSAGWLVVWSSLRYSPERYTVHVMLPLTLHVVAGLALWRTIGVARVLERIDQLRSRWGIAFLAWLVLPTAVIVSASIMTLAGMAGLPNDRLIYRLLTIAAITLVLAVLARAVRAGEGAVTGFIMYPVATAILGMVIDQFGAVTLSRSAVERTLPIVNGAMLGGVAAYCLARAKSVAGLVDRASARVLACGLVLGVLLVQNGPALLDPTYSIRNASRAIARLFPDAALLQSSGAGSLLLETEIPYRDAVSRHAVVDGIVNYDQIARASPEFVLVATFRLAVHPRYYDRSRPRMESGAAMVDVYRNTTLQHGPDPPSLPPE